MLAQTGRLSILLCSAMYISHRGRFRESKDAISFKRGGIWENVALRVADRCLQIYQSGSTFGPGPRPDSHYA